MLTDRGRYDAGHKGALSPALEEVHGPQGASGHVLTLLAAMPHKLRLSLLGL